MKNFYEHLVESMNAKTKHDLGDYAHYKSSSAFRDKFTKEPQVVHIIGVDGDHREVENHEGESWACHINDLKKPTKSQMSKSKWEKAVD